MPSVKRVGRRAEILESGVRRGPHERIEERETERARERESERGGGREIGDDGKEESGESERECGECNDMECILHSKHQPYYGKILACIIPGGERERERRENGS